MICLPYLDRPNSPQLLSKGELTGFIPVSLWYPTNGSSMGAPPQCTLNQTRAPLLVSSHAVGRHLSLSDVHDYYVFTTHCLSSICHKFATALSHA